jgi:hypothetical protein
MRHAAELRLEFSKAKGRRKPVYITVGIPRRNKACGDWYCSICHEGLDIKDMKIYGVDSWQALTLALRTIEVHLRLRIRKGLQFYWLGRKITVGRLFGPRVRL